jgi:hypothetical protein
VKLSLFHSKKESKHLALISVETGRITFSVCNLNADRSQRVLYVAKYPFAADETPSGSELARKIVEKIDVAFDDLIKRDAHALSGADALIMLGSPWHISWSDQVTLTKDKPFKVTDALIDETVTKSFETSHKNLLIIGKHVMGYKMNGYSVPNPVGKMTGMLEMRAYVESAPAEILLPIKAVVQKHIPHAKTYFSTATFSAVETIKAYSNAKDFLLIIPEHEVTDIVLVREGAIDTGASIPYGSATLARDLFGKESSGIEEAMLKSRRLLEGTLNAAEFAKATTLLVSTKEKFLSDFRSLLWKMNESFLLPGQVFIVRGGALSHFIAEWLQVEDYSKEAFTADGFKIVLVDGKDVASMLAIDPGEEKKLPFETIAGSIVGRQFETSGK